MTKHRRRRRTSRGGLAGGPAEHEQRMRMLATSAVRLAARLDAPGASCAVAVDAASDAASAIEHSYYVEGGERLRRDMIAVRNRIVKALALSGCR